MPKLGFKLLVWTAAISEKYFPHIERLKKIGYDGIEICMGHTEADPANKPRSSFVISAWGSPASRSSAPTRIPSARTKRCAPKPWMS
ncbi:MAG: hypothetical protein ACREIA_14655 [Opitutaceae bacterium]